MQMSRPVEYTKRASAGSARGLWEAGADEFMELRWILDETRELSPRDREGMSPERQRVLDAALRAIGSSARVLGDGALVFDEAVDEVWQGMCECELVSGARARLFVLAEVTHHRDRWGQTSTSAASVVVHVASGRVLLALSSADDPYGMCSSYIRHVERDGAAATALAALLLYAPEPFFERWEGVGQRDGFEWVGASMRAEVFHVDGAALDPGVEYF